MGSGTVAAAAPFTVFPDRESMPQIIYMDYNATTPADPRVVEEMLPFFSMHFGNASSKIHQFGWAAEAAVDEARSRVANLIAAEAEEIVFTSGATEAVNTAIKGVAAAYRGKGRRIVTVQTEHRAVLDTCDALEREGLEIVRLPVEKTGAVSPQAVADALTDDTILVAIMWANNELGAVNPIEEISAVVRNRGVLFMSDATQAVGKLDVDIKHVDLMALSGHKFYGPKGVGALYVRRRDPRVRLTPVMDGGGQERGRRGGTLNVPGIVGIGAAASLVAAEGAEERKRLRELRDRLELHLTDNLHDVTINGLSASRLPQTTNITFHGAPSERIFAAARTVAASIGSACSSGSGKPSHVLKAVGLSDEAARSTIRLSLGRMTTAEEVAHVGDLLVGAVKTVRESTTVSP